MKVNAFISIGDAEPIPLEQLTEEELKDVKSKIMGRVKEFINNLSYGDYIVRLVDDEE